MGIDAGVKQTLGIIGGGQLGRMLTLAALPLGFKVVALNPTPDGPASQVGAKEIVGDLYDPQALKELTRQASYITVEIEHLDTNALVELGQPGKAINPSPKTIELIQDKYLQKKFFSAAGIPVAPFLDITDKTSAKKALVKFNSKMLIKTKHGGYDGRGNMLVVSLEDIDKAFRRFKGRKLYAEGYVEFAKEIAVIVAKSINGKTASYPVVETIHKRNICLEVRAPAPVSDKVRRQAEAIGAKIAKLLNGAGTFAIEMFLTKGGEVLVNEIAPRVHNSGHYTIEANRTSQFEQHVRAVTGLPLGETKMVVPAAVMINILGERNGETKLRGLSKALKIPSVSIHIYGKSPTKIDRKMGHITATGNTLAEARQRASLARKLISI